MKKNNNYHGKKRNTDSNDRVSNFQSTKKNEAPKVNGGVFIYSKPLSVSELSKAINVPVNQIIKFLFLQGKAVTINQMLDDEMIGTICLQFNYDFKKEENVEASHFEDLKVEDNQKDLVARPPVVTVMGHVDHGKTSIIDAIRNSHVAENEAGGISQAIGAYQKVYKGQKITIIDTPGHAAFTAMRARGASVTDIVILVVAADDGVMPQTLEAIDHAKAANSQIIVAVNKMDKPGANMRKVEEQLLAHEIVSETYGGDTMFVPVSAKTGQGIDDLLEAVCLKAEMMELKANPKRYAIGTVLEANLDKGQGPKATLLIQNGTLKSSDYVVVGEIYGKIRRMVNDHGEVVHSAPPSTPVSVIGLSSVPMAGDRFMAFPTEKEAKEIAYQRALEKKNKEQSGKMTLSLNDLNSFITEGKAVNINLIIKADTEGSAEALKASAIKLSNDKVQVKVLEAHAGAISENDVNLASASNAVIYGFNIRPDSRIRELSKERGVEIRTHQIIYELLDELQSLIKGQIKLEQVEKITGQAEVRHIFKITHVGVVAGSYVQDGYLKVGTKCRLIRDGAVIYTGTIGSLQRFKDSVHEVKQGYECGITISGYNDIKEKDLIEGFEMVDKE